jgi:hypothetical protein
MSGLDGKEALDGREHRAVLTVGNSIFVLLGQLVHRVPPRR